MSKPIGSSVPFYKKPLTIILTLIFFPPIGIPLFIKYSNKPSKKAKTAISAVWGVLWIIIIISSALDSQRTYDINGKQVTIACSSYCSYIDNYGDKDALKILASLGIQEISYAPEKLKNNTAEIGIKNTSSLANRLIVEIATSKVVKIYNKEYPAIIYYSTSQNDKTTTYPSEDKIAAIIKAEEDRKAAEKAAADAKKAQEEAEQKAIAEKYPPEIETASLCDSAFHNRYPYKDSKVHSILGVIANTPQETDSRLYKVEVTIQNAFGASYDAIMECVVKKVNSSTIQITNFNVY